MALPTTTEELIEAYAKAPEETKEIITSEEVFESLETIARGYELGDTGVDIIGAFTGAVLLGFLPPEQLADALEEELEVKRAVVESVAEEINREIFLPAKKMLDETYPEEKKGGEIIVGEKSNEIAQDKINEGSLEKPADLSGLEADLPISETPEKPSAETFGNLTTSDSPFVIHEESERKSSPEAKGKQTKKGFSFSLGKVFGEQKGGEKKSPRARVEAPGERDSTQQKTEEKESVFKKEEPKVVHYSEYKTEPEIMLDKKVTAPSPDSISSFGPETKEIKPPAPPAPPKPMGAKEANFADFSSNEKEGEGADGDKKPRMEGNTIDLKKMGGESGN